MQWGVEVVEPVVESEDEEDGEGEQEGDRQQVMEMLWVVVEMRVGVFVIRLEVSMAVFVSFSGELDGSTVVLLFRKGPSMVVMESESSAMVVVSTSCSVEVDVLFVVSLSMIVRSMVVSVSKLSKLATRSPEIQASEFSSMSLIVSILRLGKATSMLVVEVEVVGINIKYSSISVIFEIFL